MQTTSRGVEPKSDNGNISSLMGNSQFIPQFVKTGTRGGTPSRRSQHGSLINEFIHFKAKFSCVVNNHIYSCISGKQSSKDAPRSGGSGSGNGGRQSSSVSGKPNIIQINLSREVKLNEAENAWKPNRIRKDIKEVKTDDEKAEIQVFIVKRVIK